MKIEDEDVEMEVSDGYEEKQLENSQRIIESLVPIPLYSLPFSTGLRLIVSGANAAATVIYE